MIKDYFNSAFTLQRLSCGLAGPFIDDFADSLRAAGYSRRTIRGHLSVAAHLGHWAKDKGLATTELGDAVGEAFRRHLPSCKCPLNPGKYCNQAAASVRLFLSHLRQLSAIGSPPAEERKPRELPVLTEFQQWMREHRGVRESTLKYYSHILRKLVDSVDGQSGRFNAGKLRSFVLDQTRNHAKHPKQVTTSIRMFVRYLIVMGKCSPNLDAAIPTVAQWRLSILPRYLPPADVERVVAACDPSTPNGSRDRAVVLLTARLGLRADDIVRLRLEDVDWKKATIQLLGKGRREARLPLTQEIGDAILVYLEQGRPCVVSDRLFIRTIAPLRPFSNSSAVSKIVRRAMARAGVDTPFRGAHVMRHSAATAMLQNGISLQDISTILRHRNLATTAYYAKVDLALLREVVQPWPEVTPC